MISFNTSYKSYNTEQKRNILTKLLPPVKSKVRIYNLPNNLSNKKSEIDISFYKKYYPEIPMELELMKDSQLDDELLWTCNKEDCAAQDFIYIGIRNDLVYKKSKMIELLKEILPLVDFEPKAIRKLKEPVYRSCAAF